MVGRARYRLKSTKPSNSGTGMLLEFTPIFDSEGTDFGGAIYLTPFGCVELGVYPKEKSEPFVVGAEYYLEIHEVNGE